MHKICRDKVYIKLEKEKTPSNTPTRKGKERANFQTAFQSGKQSHTSSYGFPTEEKNTPVSKDLALLTRSVSFVNLPSCL